MLIYATSIILGVMGAPAAAPAPAYELSPILISQSSQDLALSAALLDQLANSKDAKGAAALAGTVRKLWRSSDSETTDLLMKRAEILVNMQDYSSALDILDAVAEIAPEYPQGWYARSGALLGMSEYGRAMHDVGKVLEIEPRHFDALARLGQILLQLGDEKGALGAFEKALSIHPFLTGLKGIVQELSEKVRGKQI